VRVSVQSATRIEPLHTDDEGAFAIIVPAAPGGDLRLTKAGFVTQVVSRHDAFSSAPLVVRMIKGAAINGIVMDSLGAPAEGVSIRVRRLANGTPGPDTQVTTETDDRGEFRAGGLPPGRYTVSAGGGPTGGRGRGGLPDLDALVGRGRSASGDTARGRGGRGDGRRVGSPPAARSDLPTLDVAEGREVSTVLTYDPPAPTAAPQDARTPTPAQSRDATGAIRGRVLAHDARPIAGATVQLLPLDGEGARRAAVTDASGRYDITGLAAGRFRLRASKAGLVAVEYGQSRALQPGRVINLTSSQRLTGIDVTMPKGSAVEGTLVDAWGEPVEDASVEAWQSRFVDGRTSLSPTANVRSDRTDDRGRYRVYGLLPGSYYVVASDASARGGGPGRGGRGMGSARVFYPGTSTVLNAVPVQIDVAQDASGLDIAFSPGRTARVVGSAVSASGQPARGRATLSVSQRSGVPVLPQQMAGIDASGAFEFANVAPGDYVVQVIAGGEGGRGGGRGGGPQGGGRAGGGTPSDGGARQRGAGAGRQGGGGGAQQSRGAREGATARGRGQGGAGARGGAQSSNREFGVQFVTVGEGEVANVAVTTAPGSRITGQVVLEGAGSQEDASSFGFSAYPADADTSAIPTAGLRAVIQDDWTFELADLAGASRFRQTRAPEGWWLKSVDVNGVNAVEDPATFGQGAVSTGSITVVFASGAGVVEGRVLDDRRQPTADFSVVIFASTPDLWFSRSPYVRFASAGQDGTFHLSGLPPSQYYIAALDRIDGGTDFGDWQNPAVLGALTAAARRINVESSGRVSMELRLVQMAR
jgi:protocatechuate 3,4-dioxygenase beta subunit